MAPGMDMLCTDKTGTLTLNKMVIQVCERTRKHNCPSIVPPTTSNFTRICRSLHFRTLRSRKIISRTKGKESESKSKEIREDLTGRQPNLQPRRGQKLNYVSGLSI